MNEAVKAFCRIVPWLRESTQEILDAHPIQGEKLEIPMGNHRVTVYIHKAKRAHAPVIFELHGGGFVLGDAKKDDALCEWLKDTLDITVVGINYRKAPEHPYPAAIEDVLGVMGYFSDNADLYSIDPKRFALIGFSAGANLATVAAMKAKNIKNYKICSQVLHYPFLDAVTDPGDKKAHKADLPVEVMKAFTELYLENAEMKSLPFVSPILASKDLLADLPPTLILTAKDDALCIEGLLYGEKLDEAGIEVTVKKIENAHHGYVEDYFNEPCFEALPQENKDNMNPEFKLAAVESMKITAETLQKVFSSVL